MSKESFLILIPLAPFILLAWEAYDSETFSSADAIKALKTHIVYILFTFTTFFCGALTILFYTGDDYARSDKAKSVADYLKGFINNYRGEINIYIKIAVVAVIIGLIEVYLLNGRDRKTRRISLVLSIAVLVAGIVSQFYIYLDLVMWEHYLIPTTMFIPLFVFVGLSIIFKDSTRNSIMYYLCFVFLSGYTLFMRHNDQYYATDFANNGRQITAVIARINELSEPDTIVLSDIEYEMDNAVSIFLQERYGISNTYNVFYSKSENTDGRYHDGYHPETEEDRSISIKDADIVIVRTDSDEDVVAASGVQNQYSLEDWGLFSLYVKR